MRCIEEVQFGVCITLVDGVIIQRRNRSKRNETFIITPHRVSSTACSAPNASRIYIHDSLDFFVLPRPLRNTNTPPAEHPVFASIKSCDRLSPKNEGTRHKRNKTIFTDEINEFASCITQNGRTKKHILGGKCVCCTGLSAVLGGGTRGSVLWSVPSYQATHTSTVHIERTAQTHGGLDRRAR